VLPPAVLVAHCRAGFEPEAATDLARVAANAQAALAVDAPIGRGFVVATPRPFDAQRWPSALANVPPIFSDRLLRHRAHALSIRPRRRDARTASPR
jgi:23S rRNA C2498 (ribose-2'-O)-methylase RlmM